MGRALEQAAAVVEEPVGQPFQRHAPVRAAVLVQVGPAIPANRDDLQFACGETAALPFRQFGCCAQSNHLDLSQERRLSRKHCSCAARC